MSSLQYYEQFVYLHQSKEYIHGGFLQNTFLFG